MSEPAHKLFSLCTQSKGHFPFYAPLSHVILPDRHDFEPDTSPTETYERTGPVLLKLAQPRVAFLVTKKIQFWIHQENLLQIAAHRDLFTVGLGPSLVQTDAMGVVNSEALNLSDISYQALFPNEPENYRSLLATWMPLNDERQLVATPEGRTFPTISSTGKVVGSYEYQTAFGLQSYEGCIVMTLPTDVICLPSSGSVWIHSMEYWLSSQ